MNCCTSSHRAHGFPPSIAIVAMIWGIKPKPHCRSSHGLPGFQPRHLRSRHGLQKWPRQCLCSSQNRIAKVATAVCTWVLCADACPVESALMEKGAYFQTKEDVVAALLSFRTLRSRAHICTRSSKSRFGPRLRSGGVPIHIPS